MTDIFIFAIAALSAVWAKGRLDQAATTLAVLLAWAGVNEMGWVGWGWDWRQAGVYLILMGGMALRLYARGRDEFYYRGGKPWVDYVALVAFALVQQGVLLGWLAQVNPVLAVAVFAIVHIPNPALFAVTLVGGAASVGIAAHFGEPSILAAGLAHSGLSWWLRDWLGVDMGVGRSYRNFQSKEA